MGDLFARRRRGLVSPGDRVGRRIFGAGSDDDVGTEIVDAVEEPVEEEEDEFTQILNELKEADKPGRFAPGKGRVDIGRSLTRHNRAQAELDRRVAERERVAKETAEAATIAKAKKRKSLDLSSDVFSDRLSAAFGGR